MEVYPYGIFRLLHGKRPRSKRTVEGARLRLDLLRVHASMPDTADAWSHDGVDAAAAALVAWWGPERAAAASHRRPGCDDSAMWFPPLELHR